MTNRFRSRLIGAALVLLGAGSAAAEPMLAVSATQDGAVVLYAVNGWRLKKLNSIPTGKSPTEMCAAPDGARLYVSDAPSKNLVVVDLKAQAAAGTLTAPEMKSPDGCVVSPDSRKIYAVDQEANAVFVFSAESRTLLKKIPVGEEPRRALFSPDGKRLFVANAHTDTLSVIDPATDTIASSVKTGHEPRAMAYSPDKKVLAVTIIEDDSVGFFDAETLAPQQQVAGAISPQRVIFAGDGSLLYVLGRFDHLSVLEMRKEGPPPGFRRLAATIPVPRLAWGMAAGPSADYLFVTTAAAENSITVIDTRLMKVINTVTGLKGARDILYIP